jgi:ribosome biogenesis protein MAK21
MSSVTNHPKQPRKINSRPWLGTKGVDEEDGVVNKAIETSSNPSITPAAITAGVTSVRVTTKTVKPLVKTTRTLATLSSSSSEIVNNSFNFIAGLESLRTNGKIGTDARDWFDAADMSLSKIGSIDNETLEIPLQQQGSTKMNSLKRNRDDTIISSSGLPVPFSAAAMFQLQKIAESLLENEASQAEARATISGTSDEKWMRSAVKKGTSGDKLAAMTLLVQQSPLHSLRYIDGLLAIASKKSRRESQQAIDALKDLFIANLLPPTRRLQTFASHSSSAALLLGKSGPNIVPSSSLSSKTAEILVWWAFEDELKKRYAAFLRTLNSHMSDAVLHFKLAAIAVVSDLLCERPEAEAELLQLLTNKLGDPEGKVASRAQYLLSQLVTRHEAMKPVVVREVRQFIYNPLSSPMAHYYATLFLNQITLHRNVPELALDLISTYFSLFSTCVKRGHLGSRLLSALLTGVNRALPYTSTGKGFGGLREIQENSDSIFEVVHRGTPNTAIQALMMLQQVAQRELLSIAEMSMVAPITGDEPKNMPDYSFVDRIYRAIYGKLTVDDIASTNKHSLLLNVVFKAIKCDPLIGRARAFLKRLVQVAASSSANFAAGSIYLVAEVLASRKELRSLLISKSLRKTKVGNDIQGRPKISNEFSAQDRANALARLDAALDEEEDEEAQMAAADALQNAGDGIRINVALYKPDQKKQSEEALRNDIVVSNILIPAPHASLAKLDEEDQGKDYDIYKREPRFAGASSECLWELAPLALHFHPSVRRFAESVMYSPESSIKYDGDPIADFSTISFLDRFVYKNPKKRNLEAYGANGLLRKPSFGTTTVDQSKLSEKDAVAAELAAGYAIAQGKDPNALATLSSGLAHGTSRMQKTRARHGRVETALPAYNEAFALMDPDHIRDDDKFLHTFFRTRSLLDDQNGVPSRRKRHGDLDDDVAEDDEDEEEKYAQQLAESLMQDGGGDDDEDMDNEEDEGEEDDVNDDGDEEEQGEDFSTMDFGESLQSIDQKESRSGSSSARFKKPKKGTSIYAEAIDSDQEETFPEEEEVVVSSSREVRKSKKQRRS